MKTKLDEIITNKLQEISDKKKRRDFLDVIKYPKLGDISVIAEIKLVSPSEGKLGNEKEVGKRVFLYEKSQADAVSVVVDRKYFGGDLEFIRRIRNTVSLPVLAKDFIIDSYQIYEMKAYGADAILLIAKILSKDQLNQYVKLCFQLGLEPVVEVQNGKELKDAVRTKTRIIAVNARDLDTFNVNISSACKLIRTIPKKFITLGFSGISSRLEIGKYKNAGVKGVLVGASLMKAKNIGELIKDFKSL